jgi:hypothetical protein
MSLRRRTFPEVLDNLLADIAGGIAAEEHPFPSPGMSEPPFRLSLRQPPVGEIVSIYGSRDGQSHVFRKGSDYKLLSDQQTLEWQKGAQLPDAGTLVHINYMPVAAQMTLTDLRVGSVVRTLTETIALEIARLYAQIDTVYQSGFVDTATGSSLNKVVALLGVERVAGGRPVGEVEFTRAPGSAGVITIPAGTRITTPDGESEYATTATIALAPTQGSIRVAARDLEVGKPLAAGTLTVLPLPIAGIAKVTNPAPTAIATQDETDDELRTRAKGFLHGSERATLGAIRQAITLQGISADVEEDSVRPGYVNITLHAESVSPEMQQRLMTAIEDSRPAGIIVTTPSFQTPRKVNLELRLATDASLLEQDLRAAQRAVREKVADYFSRLPAKDAGSINRIVGLALSVPQVRDVRILSATIAGSGDSVLDLNSGTIAIAGFPTTLGELQIADPNLPTKLGAVVMFPQSQAAPDRVQIQAALTSMIAYLNTVNMTELPTESSATELAKRTLSFGKLLRVVPLPNKPGADLLSYDSVVVPPALPTEASILPYKVQFRITLESGLTRIIERASDQVYRLTPSERLSLSDLTVQAEGANA